MVEGFQGGVLTQSKTKCTLFIDYCGIIQNIKEQCGGIFIADIYVKICEDIVLNNFDRYFSIFFTDICKIL